MTSYNLCSFCENLYSNPKDVYSYQVTPHLFEWYGFIEPIPQRWVVPKARLLFDVKHADEDEANDNDLRVDFIVPPSSDGLNFIRQRLLYLREIAEKLENRTDIPQVELDGLRSFHSALVNAFSLAIKFSEGEVSEEVWSMSEDDWYMEDDSDYDEL